MTDRRSALYAPHRAEHAATVRRTADRIASKPRTLKALLAWAQAQYASEPPTNLHSASLVDEGGGPAMVGEARRYLGMTGSDDKPTDWRAVACQTDSDGSYISPFRCSLARTRDDGERAFLRDLSVDLLYPGQVAEAHGIPGWAADRIAWSALSALYDRYATEPLARPKYTELSDSQRAAEAVA